MAAPLVLVVLAAVTVRAALYRSSLAVFIAERVEVASPLNAWKRGEARRARAGALLAGPSPAGAARRSQGGGTPEPGGPGLIPAGRRARSGPAVRAPGCAPGRAGPCSPGPEPELHERALSSRAREESVGAGAAGGRGRGWSRGVAVHSWPGHRWCHTCTRTGATRPAQSAGLHRPRLRCPCTSTVSR